jgi:hypothetical protein
MTEDGWNTNEGAMDKRCMHCWEELNEKKGRVVTFDNGDVMCCGKSTGKKRTPEQIEHMETHRRSGFHIMKEVDLQVAKDKDEAEHHEQTAKDKAEHNSEASVQAEIGGEAESLV